MRRLWSWWLERANRPVDVRPFAITRILLVLCVFADQLGVLRLGLARDLYTTFAHGGLSAVKGPDFVLGFLGPNVGLMLLGTVLSCMALIGLGVLSRPATLIGVLAYAQLGAMYPGGDRAIDRIIRCTLLLLMFTQAHRCYSLPTAMGWRERVATTPGWISDVMHTWLMLMYLSAGTAKIGAGSWFSTTEPPELWRILTNPQGAWLSTEAAWLRTSWPVLRLAGIIAVINELMAPLLLTRWAPYFAVVCATMHLGISVGMKLGMFSWGMLSLYPILFAPWLVPALDKLEARIAAMRG